MGNKITHIDFHGTDRKELAAWYTSLFAWELQVFDEYDYSTFKSGEKEGGGFAVSEDGKPLVIPYVSVRDVQGTIDKIVATGGSVAVEVTEMPEVTFAVCVDPQGNKVGLVLDPEA